MNFFCAFNFSETNILASSLTDYFLQSNFAGQVIVVILLVFSVMAWGVMFCKYADLSGMDDVNKRVQQKISKSVDIIEAAAIAKQIPSPFSRLVRDAVNTLAAMEGASKTNAAMRVAMVENAFARTLSRQIEKYEEKMTLLGTIISGAPFLGLLGTAWGVMDCFGSMSGQTSVTLQQLAPGVAGALLTTVAGLVVAIPSVFGYNFLSAKIRKMSVDIENFSGYLSDRIEMDSLANEPKAVVTSVHKQPEIVETVRHTTPEAEKIIDFSLDDDSEEMSNFDEE